MDRLGTLLGSETRANLLRTLWASDAPLTSYRIAKECNMSVAKVYLEAKRLASIGAITAMRGRVGTTYALEDESLRDLVARLSGRVISYSSWSSDGAKSSRFRAGMAKVPAFELREAPIAARKPRLEGELDTLAALGRRRFASKYRRTGERAYARL